MIIWDKCMRNVRWYQRSGELGTWTTWRSTPTQTFVAVADCQYYIPDAIRVRSSTGGVLPAMMTSLALPDRRDLSVDLYPKVTFPDFITSARREESESRVQRLALCQTHERTVGTYWHLSSPSWGPSLRYYWVLFGVAWVSRLML